MLLTNTNGQAYSGKLCIHTSWNDAEVNTGVYSMTFQFLFSLIYLIHDLTLSYLPP